MRDVFGQIYLTTHKYLSQTVNFSYLDVSTAIENHNKVKIFKRNRSNLMPFKFKIMSFGLKSDLSNSKIVMRNKSDAIMSGCMKNRSLFKILDRCFTDDLHD